VAFYILNYVCFMKVRQARLSIHIHGNDEENV